MYFFRLKYFKFDIGYWKKLPLHIITIHIYAIHYIIVYWKMWNKEENLTFKFNLTKTGIFIFTMPNDHVSTIWIFISICTHKSFVKWEFYFAIFKNSNFFILDFVKLYTFKKPLFDFFILDSLIQINYKSQ